MFTFYFVWVCVCVPITRCIFTNRCFVFRWNLLYSKLITKIQTKTQCLRERKEKKVKLKGKTQILKQKQTSFLLRLQTCCTAVAKTSVQQVCKLGFKGKGVS